MGVGLSDLPENSPNQVFNKVFASHGVGGMVGNVLTALFAQSSVASFDGSTPIPGGWLDHHYVQLGYQVADSVAGFAYSFVVTVSLLIHYAQLFSQV